MYQLQEKKHQNNKKQVGVEIFRRLEDTEIPDEIETKVIFVSVIVPDGWEILNAWKPESEDEF